MENVQKEKLEKEINVWKIQKEKVEDVQKEELEKEINA